jgi:hypothetical protein
MRNGSNFEPLLPVLNHVEEELRNHIAVACSKDVREETTAELERLSDTLYEAAREARAAAALRRRIRSAEIHRQLSRRLGLAEPEADQDAQEVEPPPAA